MEVKEAKEVKEVKDKAPDIRLPWAIFPFLYFLHFLSLELQADDY
jgi:hypothetical protein